MASARQLNDGVRALMLDMHYFFGKAYLDSRQPLLGRKPLSRGAGRGGGWFMEANLGQVITLIFDRPRVPRRCSRRLPSGRADGLPVCPRAGAAFSHAQGNGARQSAVGGVYRPREGCVSLVSRHVGLLRRNPLESEEPTSFTNRSQVATRANEPCIVNHFLTAAAGFAPPGGPGELQPVLPAAGRKFVGETHRLPNFVVVDYYDICAAVRGGGHRQRVCRGRSAAEARSALTVRNVPGERLASLKTEGSLTLTPLSRPTSRQP